MSYDMFLYIQNRAAKFQEVYCRKRGLPLWEEVTNMLNSLIGGQSKNEKCKYFKYHLKIKLRQNYEHIHGTGVGPNKQYVFYTLEEGVILLLDLKIQESGFENL